MEGNGSGGSKVLLECGLLNFNSRLGKGVSNSFAKDFHFYTLEIFQLIGLVPTLHFVRG